MSEKDIEQTKTLVENFNKLDEATKDQFLIGVKGLALLQSLADDAKRKNRSHDHAQKYSG